MAWDAHELEAEASKARATAAARATAVQPDRVVYDLEIGHQLVRSATSRAYVCRECGKICVSYESQVEPCPKLSVPA